MRSKTNCVVGICVLALTFAFANTGTAYTGGAWGGALGGGSLGFGGGGLLGGGSLGGGAWGASRGGFGQPVRNLLANRPTPVRNLLASGRTPVRNLVAAQPIRSLLGRVSDRVANFLGGSLGGGCIGGGSIGGGSIGNGFISGGSAGYSGGVGSSVANSWSYGSHVGGPASYISAPAGSYGGGYSQPAISSFPETSIATFASNPVFDAPVVSAPAFNAPVFNAPAIGLPLEPAYQPTFQTPIVNNIIAPVPIAPYGLGPVISPLISGPINAGNLFDCAYCSPSLPIHQNGLPAGLIPGDLSGLNSGMDFSGNRSIAPGMAEGDTIPDGTNFDNFQPDGLNGFDGFDGTGGDEYYNGGDNPGSVLEGDGGGVPRMPIDNGDFPMPSPTEGDTNFDRSSNLKAEAVLNVAIPLDAKIYVNGRLTKTPGELRSFISRNLKRDRDYTFNLRAVTQRDGQSVELRRKVVMQAGQKHLVKFDFETPIATKVSLRVPSGATVKLAGNKTKVTKATLRHYETKLKPGQSWDDYTVVVKYEQDGEVVTREHTMTVVAGKRYVLDFNSQKSVNMFVSK